MVGIEASGLVLGARTILIRRDPSNGRLAFEADRDRCIALLSIVGYRAASPAVFRHIEAAEAHWARGDKALANLRLVFADLPKLSTRADAERLRMAEYLLEVGMSPLRLLKELGIDITVPKLDKYSPDQSRVPAGSGRPSGRWTEDPTGGDANFTDRRNADPIEATSQRPRPGSRQSPTLIQVAANGPFSAAGINVVPVPAGDTLDPKGLNLPLNIAEQQAIADTFNTILTGSPIAILSLDPHLFKNLPSDATGAVLPPPIGKYTTYRIPSSNADPDLARLVMDKGGRIFYTNNHYKSFYPVDLR